MKKTILGLFSLLLVLVLSACGGSNSETTEIGRASCRERVSSPV